MNRTEVRINLPFNNIYIPGEDFENNVLDVKIKNEDRELNLGDYLSITYPRYFISFLGPVKTVKQALVYMNSNTMPVELLNSYYFLTYSKIEKHERKTHNVPNYKSLMLYLIIDSIFAHRELVELIFKEMEEGILKDLDNVYLIPTHKIISGVIEKEVSYEKGKIYARMTKKVLRYMNNTLQVLKEDTEDSVYKTIKDLELEKYKAIKNHVKEQAIEDTKDKVVEPVLKGVRGAKELTKEEFYKLWTR